MESWQKLYGFTNNGVPCSKWQSKRTGLRICLAEVPFPEVNGYFTVATVPWSDDGCPHTLEHLIFLGSEDYPYKGMLDSLANRCFAQGTNAWTDNDHTCYTVTTAGTEGFLRILPVYVDHLLYPTLTDHGFVTEVYHVTGEGESEGVVYSEMQARENTCSEKIDMVLRQELFKDTPYVHNSGGKMADIRTLTNETIKKYHAAHYRPNNLCLIVTGPVTIEELVAAVQPMEDKIMAKGGPKVYEGYERPWQINIPPLKETVRKTIVFPADDTEEGAEVTIGLRMCDWSDLQTRQSVKILLTYLTETAISPVRASMIDCENPVAGDVGGYTLEVKEPYAEITFSGVKTKNIEQIEVKFTEVIKQQIANGIDLHRMKEVIHMDELKKLRTLESSPDNVYCYAMIDDFLYANRDGSEDEHFRNRINGKPFLDACMEYTQEDWKKLLSRLFIDQALVIVMGKPDDKESERLSSAEKQRVEKLKAEYGEAKLKQCEEEVSSANEFHERPYPDGYEKKFPVPKAENIKFIPIRSYRNDGSLTGPDTAALEQLLNKDTTDGLPLWSQFDDINSMFVEVRAILDIQDLPKELFPYVELYKDVIFELPIETPDYKLTHEETVKQFAADTVSHASGVGLGGEHQFSSGACPTFISIYLKFERKEYQKAIRWLRDLLWYTQFEPSRLKIACNRLLDSIPESKRDARTILRCLKSSLIYEKDSLPNVSNVINQEVLLNRFKQTLECDPNGVTQKLEELRAFITEPKRMRIFCATSFADVTQPKTSWIQSFIPPKLKGHNADIKTIPSLKRSEALVVPISKSKGTNVVASLGATESSYFMQCFDGIHGNTDSRVAAALVLVEYLTCCEGPFWRQLRGLGLTYSYGMYFSTDEGLLTWYLMRSTSVANCYKEALNIIRGFVNGTKEFNESDFSGAKSGTISSLVDAMGSISATVSNNVRNYIMEQPLDWQPQLIKAVDAVTIDSLKELVKQFLTQLLEFCEGVACIVCNPGKIEDVKSTLNGANCQIKEVEAEKFCLAV